MRPVFVGGCPRSGTTLLGSMLGWGPRNLTVPESLFRFTVLPRLTAADGRLESRRVLARLSEDDFFRRWRVAVAADELPPTMTPGDLIGRLARAFAGTAGKPDVGVWIDHTPANIRYAGMLAKQFPDARFVHLVRDGRAVAASVLPLDWGPNTMVDAARWWAAHIAVGFAAERSLGPDRVVMVRYEDLVHEPEVTLQKLCAFLDLPYDDDMLEQRDFDVARYSRSDHRRAGAAPDPDRSVSWRARLRPREVEHFEHLTWDLLSLLDYEMAYGPGARIAPRHERLAAFAVDVARRGLIDPIRRRRRLGKRRSS